jgi:hypothetical protein
MGAMRTMLLKASVCTLLLVAACGDDDGDSAADRTCQARDDVSSAVATVRDDVEAGNFGDAQDSLGDVRTAFEELEQSFDDLAQEQRQELQPQIDAVRADVEALGDVTSLDQLSTAFESIQTDFEALIDATRDDLDCG